MSISSIEGKLQQAPQIFCANTCFIIRICIHWNKTNINSCLIKVNSNSTQRCLIVSSIMLPSVNNVICNTFYLLLIIALLLDLDVHKGKIEAFGFASHAKMSSKWLQVEEIIKKRFEESKGISHFFVEAH